MSTSDPRPSIEQAIQEAVTEIIADAVGEAVKNAVSEALEPITVKLEVLEDMLTTIRNNTYGLPTTDDVRRAAAESIDYSLSELKQVVRDTELNAQRAELRQSGALRRIL